MTKEHGGPTHVTPVNSFDPNNHTNDNNTSIRGRRTEILFAFSLMTLPITAFTAILLGLIFSRQIKLNPFASPNLSFEATGRDSAIYVDLSATLLVTIASWSSSIAPILVGCAVTLISYPIAKNILVTSEKLENVDNLPTPYQLSLILQAITNGGISALWNCMRYTFWGDKRDIRGRSIKLMTYILSTGVFLSFLVIVTDTWLHVTTKTVQFTQITPSPAVNHSFALREDCYDVKTTFQGGCTINAAATAVFVLHGAGALQVLSNISDAIEIKSFTNEQGRFSYIDVPGVGNVDYTANSWAVRTTCTPVTKECIIEEGIIGPYAPFKCPFAFEGRISTTEINSIVMTYFTDTRKDNITVAVGLKTPYQFAAVASVNQNVGRFGGISGDDQITSGLHGSTLFAVSCEAHVFDFTFSKVNGTLTNMNAKAANDSTTNIVQGTQAYTDIGNQNLLQAAAVATFSYSAQEVADKFADAYSATALAAASAAIVPVTAQEAQIRTVKLVARVPKVPLAFLLAANMAIVGLGIVLAILACMANRGDVGEVQARLNVPALVALHFEDRSTQSVKSVDDMYGELYGVRGSRVRIDRTERAGWMFGLWRSG